jgi:predicted secreted protein with PEFG-CTERM motif
MDIRIFYVLTILTVVSSGTAFAENSLISVQTDNGNYDEGNTILISGSVTTIVGDTQVTLQLFKEGNLIEIAQIKVSQDGNYSHTIIAQGPQWKSEGEYIVKVTYGEANIAEVPFTFTPKSELVETISNYEVNAGSSGTFDISYSIRGGSIQSISVDPEIFGLRINIDAITDGTIILDLPREYIDAEKQDGKDEVYIILIDSLQTPYDEKTTYSEIRTLSINFEQGDSEIQIIGTRVIPEFGTIGMVVLTIGIITSILLTRNRFQIKI